jgi:hypothetical protein
MKKRSWIGSRMHTSCLQGRHQRPLNRMWRAGATTAAIVAILTALVSVPKAAAKKKPPLRRTITGQVLDESDNPVAGAVVELTDTQTGKKLDIYSEGGGHYQFPDLDPTHDYKIQASFKGASSEVRDVSSLDGRMKLVINLTVKPPSAQ